MQLTAKLVVLVKTHGLKVAKVVILLAAAVVNPTAQAIQALRAAIEAACSTATKRCALVASAPVTDTLTVSDYNTVQDKMLLTFVAESGAKIQYRIPGPKAVCFLPDSDKVDVTAAPVAALITAIKNNALARDASVITDCLGGRRMRFESSKPGAKGVPKA